MWLWSNGYDIMRVGVHQVHLYVGSELPPFNGSILRINYALIGLYEPLKGY